MKKLIFFGILTCFAFGSLLNARDMIYTYWHELDGPYWVYKPLSISVAQSYIYSFGSDKDENTCVFVSDNNGIEWSKIPIDQGTLTSISASQQTPLKAYYTSQGENVYYSSDGGIYWTESANPPTNLAFNVCAANPIHADTAIVGCSYSTDGGTLWKTTNHGQTWTDIDFIANTVNDIVWHETDDLTFYVATDGENPPAIWNSTDGGANFTPLTSSGFISAKCITTKILNNTNYIVACGIFEEDLAIKYSTDEGENWEQVYLPSAAISQIRDIQIIAYGGQNNPPEFVIATDVGIFKHTGSSTWTHIYNNPGDNNVFSIAYSASASKLFAGTLHSFISIDANNEYTRIKQAMFKADLKASCITTGNPSTTFALNKKTGAIFGMNLDFSQFHNGTDSISIGSEEVVANISGEEGDYDGLAIASDSVYDGHDHLKIIIASSNNSSGQGKLIRFDGYNWQDVNITGCLTSAEVKHCSYPVLRTHF